MILFKEVFEYLPQLLYIISTLHVIPFGISFLISIILCYSYITPWRDVSDLQSRVQGREVPEGEGL